MQLQVEARRSLQTLSSLYRSCKWNLILAVFALAWMSAVAQVQPNQERTVLTVSWADGHGTPVKFSLSALEKLEHKKLVMELPPNFGLPGKHEWSGVPLRSVLAAAKIEHFSTMRVVALDGYQVSVPAEDLTRYDPILAYRRDGQYIAIRDRGPLFLLYPFDQYPELQKVLFLNRTIWQASTITLQ